MAAIRAGTAPRATPEPEVADRVAMLVVVDRAGTEGKQAEAEAGMGTAAATGEETRNLIIRNCSTYVPSGFDREKPHIFAKAF